jgi:hypothetical protein
MVGLEDVLILRSNCVMKKKRRLRPGRTTNTEAEHCCFPENCSHYDCGLWVGAKKEWRTQSCTLRASGAG